MRKGVALLVTLTLLAGVATLVLKGFTLSKSFFDDANEIKSIYQISALKKDMEKILPLVLKDINDTEAFDFLFSRPFPIGNDTFPLVVSFKPTQNRLNVNLLLKKDGETDKNFYAIFDDILIKNNIADSSFFLNLLLDTIDSDTKERVYGSEIVKTQHFFRDGKIHSFEHFKKIQDYYAMQRNDKNIYKIKWRELIGFENQTLDINFASKNLLQYLLPNIYIDDYFSKATYDSYESLGAAKEEEERLGALGVVFSTKRVAITVISQTQNLMQLEGNFDLKSGKFEKVKYVF